MPKQIPEIVDLTQCPSDDDDFLVYVPVLRSDLSITTTTATTTNKRPVIEKPKFKKKSKKKSLNEQLLSELKELKESVTCSICLDPYKDPVMVRNDAINDDGSNNSQIYCANCIWDWCTTKNKQKRIPKDPITGKKINQDEINVLPVPITSIIKKAVDIVNKYDD